MPSNRRPGSAGERPRSLPESGGRTWAEVVDEAAGRTDLEAAKIVEAALPSWDKAGGGGEGAGSDRRGFRLKKVTEVGTSIYIISHYLYFPAFKESVSS